jgi:uncharacterized delta-60 repeat protein
MRIVFSPARAVAYSVFITSLLLSFVVSVSAAPGDLDASFGVQGRQLVTVSTNPIIAIHNNTTDVIVQPDGKILVAGYAYFGVNPTSGDDFVVMRFNPNGSLDSGFANGGIFLYDFQSGSDHLNGIALQPDGKIVAAGQVQINPFNQNPNTAFAVIRLNPNGAFDASFGTNGLVVTDFLASLDQATEVAIQPDGKILASGWSTRSDTNNGAYDFALVRYNPNGTLDPGFGTGGAVFTDFNGFGDLAQTSVLQPDGKIVLAGWVWVNTVSEYDFGLARYNANGTLDPDFGAGGKVVTPIGSNLSELVRGMSLAPGGKLVVTGDLYNPPSGNIQGNRDIVAVRYNPNGSLDATFDGDGKFIYGSTLGDRSESGGDTIVQPDGKILLTGRSHLRTESVPGGTVSHTEMITIRLNVNGSFDTNFGANGITLTDFGIVTPEPDRQPRTGDSGEAITLQPDGKIVVAGEAVLGNGDYRFVVARFLNDIGSIAVRRPAFDFDGDGRADQSVFRPSDRTWYLLGSQSGFSGVQFGLSSDRIAPADFDGDGRTDVAVFRNGTWYWLNSSNGSFNAYQFGVDGDIPVPSDYTGDGRSELAVYRSGVWYTLNLADNQFQAVQFGISSDRAVPADYDGDGKTDYAVYRDGTWYLLRSTAGFAATQFGIASDKPVVGDYDGDGKTDLAVYRAGVWYILQSSTQGFFTVQFGAAGDVPVAADYDGDGKTDIAVYRDGAWYLLRSAQGFGTVQFGVASDKPVPAAFVP